MYTILINEDNSLVTTTKERIMQRSKLVDTLWFIVPPDYKGYSMADFTVMLEYLAPISREYRSEILKMSDEMYNGHLKYLLPFDTKLTAEAGAIEVQLTFAMSDLDVDGNAIQRVRKTSATTINIIPISAWSDIIPDSALSAIDQRLIKADAQIKALEEIGNVLSESKADDLSYNTANGELQLMSGSTAIGNKVTIMSCTGDDGESGDNLSNDGVPVVMF